MTLVLKDPKCPNCGGAVSWPVVVPATGTRPQRLWAYCDRWGSQCWSGPLEQVGEWVPERADAASKIRRGVRAAYPSTLYLADSAVDKIVDAVLAELSL